MVAVGVIVWDAVWLAVLEAVVEGVPVWVMVSEEEAVSLAVLEGLQGGGEGGRGKTSDRGREGEISPQTQSLQHTQV